MAPVGDAPPESAVADAPPTNLGDAPANDLASDVVTDTPDASIEPPRDVPPDHHGPCRPGLSLCGDVCVNLAIDNASCGACGRRCQGIDACAGGRCVGPGSACGEGGYPCCSDAGAPCVSPLVCELGICTAAPRACGHRGEPCCPGALVCETGTTCSGGMCR